MRKPHNLKAWREGLAIAALAGMLFQTCVGDSRAVDSRLPDAAGPLYTLAAVDSVDKAVAYGRPVFEQYCAICHGETGDGNGFNAYNLKSHFGVQPFAFTDSLAAAQVGFAEVAKAIREGGSAVGKSPYMPPWRHTLTEYELAAVTAFVWTRLMKKTPVQDP